MSATRGVHVQARINIDVDLKTPEKDKTRVIEASDIWIHRAIGKWRASLSRDTSRFSGNNSLFFLGVWNAGHDKVLSPIPLNGALWLSKPRNRNFHD